MATRSLTFNQLYGSIPSTLTQLTHLTFLCIEAIPILLLPTIVPPACSDLSHNYLTGSELKPLAVLYLDLSSNFLLGPLPDEACQPLSFDANCFTLPQGCALVSQRQEAACIAFCGVSSVDGGAAACGGHGVCYPQGPSLAPTCLCNAGFVRFGDIDCVAQGQGLSGYGLHLAFHANFTFSLSPQSGRVGFNGFAFVVSATDRVGRGTGVGYGGMDKRSVAVEFDTQQDKQHGDMSSQHVGLNIRGEDKSLAAVPSPFPMSSKKAYTAWVDYEPGDPGTIQVFLADSKEKPREAVLERRLAFPFPRYMSADYRVAPGKQDSWVVSDFHSLDSVPFLGWPVKDQKDSNACWAFALVASVEAAYGIATNGEAPQLSVESLFAAMGLTSEADKCSTGGSPTEALETLLMLPNSGITEAGAHVSSEVEE
ncbi:unnamed protein product [Closterium sp. NIES-65]|nr:unnamed protein product [Closterium sp. NIES-65]